MKAADRPMMKCGHAANSIHDGKPACVVCFGLDNGATIIDDDPPDLSQRRARCFYYGKKPRKNECQECRGKDACACERSSDPEQNGGFRLMFFGHRPDEAFDEFYCGCKSWD